MMSERLLTDDDASSALASVLGLACMGSDDRQAAVSKHLVLAAAAA